MPDLPTLQEMAARDTEKTVTLSSASVAVLFSALADVTSYWSWSGAGLSLTDAEKSEIDTILENASRELMTEVLPVTEDVGSVKMWIGDDAPTGWHLCNGAFLDQIDYPDLYAMASVNMKVTFGGHIYVKLPDLRDRFPRGAGDTPLLGGTGGANSVNLAVANLPAHHHQQTNYINVPVYESSGVSGSNQRNAAGATTNGTTPNVTGDTGSGTAFSIVNSFCEINFIIKVLP
jgi:microcystin-dependent protein